MAAASNDGPTIAVRTQKFIEITSRLQNQKARIVPKCTPISNRRKTKTPRKSCESPLPIAGRGILADGRNRGNQAAEGLQA
jgi:hypothetical protein